MFRWTNCFLRCECRGPSFRNGEERSLTRFVMLYVMGRLISFSSRLLSRARARATEKGLFIVIIVVMSCGGFETIHWLLWSAHCFKFMYTAWMKKPNKKRKRRCVIKQEKKIRGIPSVLSFSLLIPSTSCSSNISPRFHSFSTKLNPEQNLWKKYETRTRFYIWTFNRRVRGAGVV